MCCISGRPWAPATYRRGRRGCSASSSKRTACSPPGGSTPTTSPRPPGLGLWAALQVRPRLRTRRIKGIVLVTIVDESSKRLMNELRLSNPSGCGAAVSPSPVPPTPHPSIKAVELRKPRLSHPKLLKRLAGRCRRHVTRTNTNGFWHSAHRVQRRAQTECLSGC